MLTKISFHFEDRLRNKNCIYNFSGKFIEEWLFIAVVQTRSLPSVRERNYFLMSG